MDLDQLTSASALVYVSAANLKFEHEKIILIEKSESNVNRIAPITQIHLHNFRSQIRHYLRLQFPYT